WPSGGRGSSPSWSPAAHGSRTRSGTPGTAPTASPRPGTPTSAGPSPTSRRRRRARSPPRPAPRVAQAGAAEAASRAAAEGAEAAEAAEPPRRRPVATGRRRAPGRTSASAAAGTTLVRDPQVDADEEDRRDDGDRPADPVDAPGVVDAEEARQPVADE